MKKITLLIGLTLITAHIFGQNKNIEFGLKGGLNYSNFIDSNNKDIPAKYSNKIGFHIGGFVSIGLNGKISVRPEILFSQQGSDFSIKGSDFNIHNPNDNFVITYLKGQIKESLIVLPIIIEYQISNSFDLGFGPQFSYLLNRKLEYDNQGLGFIKDVDSEKFEIGIDLELGYMFSDKYRIGLRYNYGITERQNLHSSVIQLGISYKL